MQRHCWFRRWIFLVNFCLKRFPIFQCLLWFLEQSSLAFYLQRHCWFRREIFLVNFCLKILFKRSKQKVVVGLWEVCWISWRKVLIFQREPCLHSSIYIEEKIVRKLWEGNNWNPYSAHVKMLWIKDGNKFESGFNQTILLTLERKLFTIFLQHLLVGLKVRWQYEHSFTMFGCVAKWHSVFVSNYKMYLSHIAKYILSQIAKYILSQVSNFVCLKLQICFVSNCQIVLH